MASPAPIATLCQLARQGGPLLAALLLALLLGWSALHEGTRSSQVTTPALQAQDSLPAAPFGTPPLEQAMPRVEAEPDDSRSIKSPLLRQLCGPLPVPPPVPATAPSPYPAPALPSRYQHPPGQAPPSLLS